MNRHFAPIALLFVLVIPLSAEGAGRSDYILGLTAYEAGDLDGAKAKLIAVDASKSPHAAYMLAVIAERQGKYADAIRNFNMFLVNAKPSNELIESAKAHRAFCLVANGEYNRAAQKLVDSPSQTKLPAPSLVFAVTELNYAIAKRSVTYAKQAIIRYRYVLDKHDAESPDALNGLGCAYLLMGELDKSSSVTNYAESCSYFARAVERRTIPVYCNNYGVSLYRIGRNDEAVTQFKKAIQIADPAKDREVIRKAKLNLHLVSKKEA
jgi:tetratricopeptide (TPR) repeat protein